MGGNCRRWRAAAPALERYSNHAAKTDAVELLCVCHCISPCHSQLNAIQRDVPGANEKTGNRRCRISSYSRRASGWLGSVATRQDSAQWRETLPGAVAESTTATRKWCRPTRQMAPHASSLQGPTRAAQPQHESLLAPVRAGRAGRDVSNHVGNSRAEDLGHRDTRLCVRTDWKLLQKTPPSPGVCARRCEEGKRRKMLRRECSVTTTAGGQGKWARPP